MEIKIDIDELVNNHGDYLFRYALVKIKDESLAEDLVQETYLAAIKSVDTYQGRSAEKTWLISILKNKIVDHYHKYSKEVSFEAEDIERFDTGKFFERKHGWSGFWNRKFRPARWRMSSETILENKEFYKMLDACLGKLPEKVEGVFRLRELDGEESHVVQESFGISSSNYWIIMHRARLSLRRCVEINWFSSGKA